MLNTLQKRKYLSGLILLVAIVMAIYVAVPGDNIGVPPHPPQDLQGANWLVHLIDLLNRIELVHICSHILVFGGVAMLLGPWGEAHQQGDFRLALRYVLWGAFLMELGQIIVGYSDDHFADLVWGTTFDIFVDVLAAGTVLLLTRLYAKQVTSTAQKLHLA